mgnify:CR=1 FL=1|tara:strand:- start:4439 stop:5047 length:609 start_codon:yes stop_codon:yes gene_type:complete
MPNVNGQQFPYTPEGMQQAQQAQAAQSSAAKPSNQPATGMNPMFGDMSTGNQMPMFGGMSNPPMGRPPVGGQGDQKNWDYDGHPPMSPWRQRQLNKPRKTKPSKTPGLSDNWYGVPPNRPYPPNRPWMEQGGLLPHLTRKYPNQAFQILQYFNPELADDISGNAMFLAGDALNDLTGGRTNWWLDKVKGIQTDSDQPGFGGP